MASSGALNGDLVRLAEIQERIGVAERRLSEIEDERTRLATQDITAELVAAALGEFDAVWGTLTPKEQARVLALLIERVDHDGTSGNVAITFNPTGLKVLGGPVAQHEESAA